MNELLFIRDLSQTNIFNEQEIFRRTKRLKSERHITLAPIYRRTLWAYIVFNDSAIILRRNFHLSHFGI